MWYENSFRRTLLDMHIEDWDDTFLSEFDPEEYFESIKEAECDAVMIYVQSHVGLCYWPVKTGVMHRAFLNDNGKMKRLFSLCEEAKIATVLYYSIIYNNRAYEQHPDWRLINADGYASRENGTRYGFCCPNNKDYLAFVKEQIREFSAYFNYDGVFFDMTFWPESCYCKSCQARWESEVGGSMPRTVDWRDDRFLKLVKKQHEWLREFAMTITEEAKRCKPEISVEHQYSASMHNWRYGNNENIADASDYIGTDLYGGIKQQSLACKAWYHLTGNQPFQYMTSRCYPSLSEHTTTRTLDQLRQCVAMTYIHHGAALLIDAIDPIGTIDKEVYRLIGKVYREMKPCEKYMKTGKMQYDAALYYNLNGKMNVDVNGLDTMDQRLRHGEKGVMPHQEALFGACNALRTSHIPFGVINNRDKDEMFRHKVLILPDVPMMEQDDIRMVLSYIRQGGGVYFSGHTAPELLKEVFGLTWSEYTDEDITYMAKAEGCSLFDGFYTGQSPMAMKEKAVRVKGVCRGEVLAYLTLPYTKPTKASTTLIKNDVGRFASIHSNPPGIPTDYPALIRNTYGKGTVIWSAVPIERADRYQHEQIFARIIRELCGNCFTFSADAPESVECVLFADDTKEDMVFGIVDIKEGYVIPETRDCTYRIAVKRAPVAVHDIKNDTDLAFEYRDDSVYVRIESMKIWTMISVKF